MVGPGSNADPRTWKERPFLGDPEHLTVDYIRDQLNRNQYNGDVFRALKFMVQEYDDLIQEHSYHDHNEKIY